MRSALLALLLLAPVARADGPKLRADQLPGAVVDPAHGQELFAACAPCHGSYGQGRLGKAPRLRGGDYLAVVSNDTLYRAIAEGRPGTDMIPWGNWLEPQEIRDLVAWLRSWQSEDGVVLDESPLDTSEAAVSAGGELFAARCAACHGAHADGYAEGGQGLGIGRATFLGQMSDGTLRAIVASGKHATPMPAFDHESPAVASTLGRTEIDAVLAWLRANAH